MKHATKTRLSDIGGLATGRDIPKKPDDEVSNHPIREPHELGAVSDLFSMRVQRVEYVLSRAIRKAWADQPLRTGTIGSLAQIAEHPGISLNEIAQRLVLDKSAITLIVNNLEKLGWIDRRTSATDRRRQSLHATELGLSELSGFVERVKAIETEMLATIPAPVVEQLCDFLDQIHASCLTYSAAEDDNK